MHKIRDRIGWLAVVFMVCFCIFCAWEYMVRLRHCEERISDLEASARPLFVVDKYSMVELNGQRVTLAEELKRVKNDVNREPREIHEQEQVHTEAQSREDKRY